MTQGAFFNAEEMAEMRSGLCPPAPKDYVLPTAFPSLAKAARIALDFETYDPGLDRKKRMGNGVYRKDGYVCGAAIAAWDADKNLIHAEYYPTRHRNAPNCDEEKVFSYLRDNLNYFEGELTGANVALYDGDWAQSKGIRPRYAKWRDIQWAEALIDELAFSYKLETLAQKYLHRGKVTDHFQLLYGPDYIHRFHEVHPGHARRYGLGDVLLPNWILDEQLKELESLKLLKLFEMECRLVPMLLYMREKGVRIDRAQAERLQLMLEEKRAVAVKRAAELSGAPFTVDNFGDTQLLLYAFNKLGIKVPRTKTGPSIKDKWLKQHCGEFGIALAAANRYDKAKETFVDGYVFKHAVGDRIHCEFHPLRKADDDEEAGTESGRFSSTNPNLQNIPARDDEIGPECRAMFVPEIGGEWWAMDGSQIEYRWLVHFACEGIKDKETRKWRMCTGADAAQAMYINDAKTDFHTLVSTLTGLPRKDAKNLNFGLVYGMGLSKLCRTLHDQGIPNVMTPDGKPTDDLKKIWDTYHAKAPFVKELLEYWSGVASEAGEIRTYLNRRSQFEFYEPQYTPKGESRRTPLPLAQALEAYGFLLRRGDTHKALNRKIQGSAAEWMKYGMVLAWESGVFTNTSDFTASLTVHDELDGTVFPTPRGKECYAELKHILETCIKLHVPVYVGDGIGANWSDAK